VPFKLRKRDFKYHDMCKKKIKKKREKENEKMESIRVLAISPKGRL
jgi:hypothetical protein